MGKLKETEAALKRSLDEKGLTLRQSASDQEVISFLDSRTQVCGERLGVEYHWFTTELVDIGPPLTQHLSGLKEEWPPFFLDSSFLRLLCVVWVKAHAPTWHFGIRKVRRRCFSTSHKALGIGSARPRGQIDEM